MKQPPFDNLADWLAWQERLHPREIELGLDRVRQVAQVLDILQPAPFVIIVGGTNGKGSSVHMLAQAMETAGQRTATYTSPHLTAYNERIVINGRQATDAALCEAFSAVEAARHGVSLTYFEYGTLAALWLIKRSGVDIALLEVGLGGRLDAVNIVDADIALVTNVGLDHRDWLGEDRETISREKAGIFRSGRQAVYNDPQPAKGVLQAAGRLDARLYCLGRDYDHEHGDAGWCWWHGNTRLQLPVPAGLPPHQFENMAGVLMCLSLAAEQLNFALPSAVQKIGSSLPCGRSDWRQVQTDGRQLSVLLDVAHNLEAARSLAGQLAQRPCSGRTLALFAALEDKPIEEMTALMAPMVDEWLVAGLTTSRGLNAQQTLARMPTAVGRAAGFTDPPAAWREALVQAGPEDRVVVFGSFYTVQAVLECIGQGMEGRTGND